MGKAKKRAAAAAAASTAKKVATRSPSLTRASPNMMLKKAPQIGPLSLAVRVERRLSTLHIALLELLMAMAETDYSTTMLTARAKFPLEHFADANAVKSHLAKLILAEMNIALAQFQEMTEVAVEVVASLRDDDRASAYQDTLTAFNAKPLLMSLTDTPEIVRPMLA